MARAARGDAARPGRCWRSSGQPGRRTTARCRLAQWLVPGLSLGALAAGPPGVPGGRAPARAGRLRSGSGATRTGSGAARSRAAVVDSLGVVARRRALDGPQRDRPRPLRADLHRRRPGPLRRHLPALRRQPGKGRRRACVARTPGTLRPAHPSKSCGLEQVLARARRSPPPPGHRNPTRPSTQMGRGATANRHHPPTSANTSNSSPPRSGDLVPRPPRRDAHASLGGPALGTARLRPARSEPPGVPTPLGGLLSARSSSRSPYQRLAGRLSTARTGDAAPSRCPGRSRDRLGIERAARGTPDPLPVNFVARLWRSPDV